MRALARQVLDLGADLYWGHSNHTVQGVEVSGGRPILYACGDFVDDYAVDPVERNDLSVFVEAEVQDGAVRRLRLHPVRIDGLRVHRAGSSDARWVLERVRARCAALGTDLDDAGEVVLETSCQRPARVSPGD